MAKEIQTKLTVELVPKTCHYSNVRTTVSAVEWDLIRFLAYAKANHVCEICGHTGLEQGYKHKVECHEIWEYDDKNKIQRLAGLISLCPLCHQVKHVGRANAMGKQAEVFKQLEEVNGWCHKEVVEHIAACFEKYKERSKFQWKLDLSLLANPPYNIKINLDAKRKFKKTPFKRKKKS